MTVAATATTAVFPSRPICGEHPIMQNQRVSKTEFKARALEYFRQVEATGKPVLVTDHGKPTLEIRRYQPLDRSPREVLHDSVSHFDAPFEPVGQEDWDAAQ